MAGFDDEGDEDPGMEKAPIRPLISSKTTHVDTDNGADHLGDDDHVTEVGLDHSGLGVRSSVLLSGTELLDETHRAALKTALEPPASTSVDELLMGVVYRWRCDRRDVPGDERKDEVSYIPILANCSYTPR